VVLTPDQLNPAEKALWQAFPSGTPVDLRTGDGGDTIVRAEVIATLLRGDRRAEAGQPCGIRLLGATVNGLLDLTYSNVTVPLWLEECRFDDIPDMTGAVVRGVKIIGCELPGFVGRLMRIDGDLDFRGSVIRGRLALIRATVTGELRLNDAQLINPGGWALFAGGIIVESALFGSFPQRVAASIERPMMAEGGIRLTGARILGGLFLEGVHLRNPGGTAFHGDNMTVFGRMMCGNGFLAEGRVQLPHARIEGELSFAGATLDDPDVALSLSNSTVSDLNLRTATPTSGLVDLRHLRCDVLRDSVETWPARLAMDGLLYDAIDSGYRSLSVTNRLDWLRRDQDGYRPQPYEQLAAHYRRLGADADARQVLLDKQRQHRQHLNPPARVLGHLLDWTVGYGYRPWRAAVWLVLMLGLGTTAFSVWPPSPDGSGRRFDAVMYTLDLLLPISAFGLRDAFSPIGITRWLAYGLTAAGWLLVTALIAGITRAVRRD
jgi:hypothetical protein